MSLPLTSDLIQLLQAYLPRFEKKKHILEKQLDDQLPQQVLKPVSLKSQKIQKAQVTLSL